MLRTPSLPHSTRYRTVSSLKWACQNKTRLWNSTFVLCGVGEMSRCSGSFTRLCWVWLILHSAFCFRLPTFLLMLSTQGLELDVTTSKYLTGAMVVTAPLCIVPCLVSWTFTICCRKPQSTALTCPVSSGSSLSNCAQQVCHISQIGQACFHLFVERMYHSFTHVWMFCSIAKH